MILRDARAFPFFFDKTRTTLAIPGTAGTTRRQGPRSPRPIDANRILGPRPSPAGRIPHPAWTEYGYFLNVAARNMRQILIDHGRAWARRVNGKAGVPIMDHEIGVEAEAVTSYINKIVSLSQAIERLDELDPVLAQITDLELMMGLTLNEIADELSLDLSAVKREWLIAEKYLGRNIRDVTRARPITPRLGAMGCQAPNPLG